MTNRFLKTGIAVFMPVALVLALLLFAPAAAFAEEAGGFDFHEENSSPAAETSFSSGDFSTSAITSFPDSTTSSGFDSSITPAPESETPVSDINAPLPASDSPVLNGFESLPEETSAEPCAPATSSNVSEGNSYVAEITPDAFATGGNIPDGYSGLEGGDTADFTVTFTEVGDKVIAAAQVEIPTEFTGILFDSAWTSVGISTSSGQQWEGRLDDVFIYLRAVDEADYLTRNEWVSVTFNATSPTENGAYSFETMAWTKEPDDFGDTDFGVTAPAGTNNMAAGYKHPLVIVGTSVSTPAELAALNTGFSPVYYVQTADIDLYHFLREWNNDTQKSEYINEKKGWIPIGTSSSPFYGSFNGNGFEISNLYIDRTGEGYVGLIGTTYFTTNLININLVDVDVSGGGLGDPYAVMIGALAARNYGGYILNCKVSGSVNNLYAVDSNGDASGYDRVGGLVGLNTGSTAYIANSSSSATVNGYRYTGGLVGSMANGSVIANSSSSGPVTGYVVPSGSGYGIGGLVGYTYHEGGGPHPSNIITRSYATGKVEGVSDVGGLVGYAFNTVITDSYATGQVTGVQYEVTENSNTYYYGGNWIGGLVGSNSTNSSIYRSYATGDTKGTSLIGGLVGITSGLKISDCYASGNVAVGGNTGGGLAGWNDSQITNCFSTGTVTYTGDIGMGGSTLGGFVGHNTGFISNCYARGSVSGESNVGGLVGSTSGNGGISFCYSTGNVTHLSNFYHTTIGGLVGYNSFTNENAIYTSYYDSQTSGRSDNSGKGIPKTTAEMQSIGTFSDWSIARTAEFDPYNVKIWYILDDSAYPKLAGQYNIVTVKADDFSKVYGEIDPAFAVTYAGFKGNDDETVLGGTLFIDRESVENVGSFAITPSWLTPPTGNEYLIHFVDGTLTITKLPITVTADTKSKVYGEADPAFTYATLPTIGSALANGQTVSLSGALSRDAGEKISVYSITHGTMTDEANPNYAITFNNADLTINARPITVTADPKAKTFGDTDPDLTYQITSGSLAFIDTFSGALTRAAGEEVGAYNILQGSLALTSNYILSYIGAVLTITEKVDDPPSIDPPPGDPSPDTTIDGSSEPSTGLTAQPSGLIFSSAGSSPAISADLIISGTAVDLAEAQALYQAMLEAFEQNMTSMTEAEYAVAVIELAVARAAIMVMEARLSGDPAALATAIEAYQFAQQQLAVYGSYLGGEQSAVVESLMSAIDSVITALGG